MPFIPWLTAYAPAVVDGMRGRRRLPKAVAELKQDGGRTAGGWWRTILRGGSGVGGRWRWGTMDFRFRGAGVGDGRLRPAEDR